MKAISSRNLCAFALLLLLAGCGGGTTPPCSGTTCLAPASDFLFESNLNQISTFQVDSNVGVVLATLPPVTGPNAAGGMVLSSNNFLYVSDFENNTVDAFSVNTSSGVLTSVSGSPFNVGANPGAGGMAVDPAGKFLFVTQPNASQVAAFTINSMGQLAAVANSPFPAGSFPVQAVVDPSGSFLYVSNNHDPLGGISAYTIGSTGGLSAISGSPFPTLLDGPAGLAVHPNGKFLYIAMAGTANPNNKIVVESIDGTTGALSPISSSPFLTGSDPNAVTLDPAGKFLFSANVQDSNVTVFTVDANAGSLSPLGGNSFAAGPGTFRIVVNPSGALLFAANNGSTSISAYTIAPNGLLTPVAPIAGGQQASGLAIVHHP